jgi:hypothetical protein
MIDRDPNPGTHLEGWLRNAGFVELKQEIFKLPLGVWPKDEKLVRLAPMRTRDC